MSEKFKTSIGGQALIEGVMMRGPDKSALSVRGKDGLVTEVSPYVPLKKKHKIYGWPLIRGIVGFGASMAAGVKALMRSADLAFEGVGTEPEGKFEAWVNRKIGKERAEGILTGIAVVLGVLLPVGLFILLPSFLASLLGTFIGSGLWRNILEGALRIAIFVGYLGGVSLMKDMRRTFQYHGAEHKSIACYESGAELTVDNARDCTRFHPRCGTSFLFVVVIISTLLFSVVSPDTDNILVRMGIRLALLPAVVAISYEFNQWAGRHDNVVSRFLRAPGLWLQRLTVFEPDDSMLEAALAALTAVLPSEEGADRW